MFLDPTGRHLIITTQSGDNYYLYAKWKKAKLLSKIKVLKNAKHVSRARLCAKRKACGLGEDINQIVLYLYSMFPRAL